jgi:hypothetical protein
MPGEPAQSGSVHPAAASGMALSIRWIG